VKEVTVGESPPMTLAFFNRTTRWSGPYSAQAVIPSSLATSTTLPAGYPASYIIVNIVIAEQI